MKFNKLFLGSLILAGALGTSSIAFAAVSSVAVSYGTQTFYTFALSCSKASLAVSGDSAQSQSGSSIAQQFGNQNCKLTLKGLNKWGTPTTVTLATLHTTIKNGLLGYTNYTTTSRTGKQGTGLYYDGYPGSKELFVKVLTHSEGNGTIRFSLTDSSIN